MNNVKIGFIVTLTALLTPILVNAQTGHSNVADEIMGLHTVLDTLFEDMIPHCEQLIDIGRGVAGFAAIFYIGSRVWAHIARAEPIDFYPLLRPFAITLCITFFMNVVQVLNGVLKPISLGTEEIVKNENNVVETLLAQKEAAVKNSDKWKFLIGESGDGDRKEWYKYYHPNKTESWLETIPNDMSFAFDKLSYKLRNAIKEFVSIVLQIIFAAVSLCINTIRIFYLIILVILGPLVFGLSVFDGFQHTLKMWLAKYINIFLWLPVCHIFGSVIGKIQEQMLLMDLKDIKETGDTMFSANDFAYMVFMIIAIAGYLTVPSITSMIVQVGHEHKALLSSSTGTINSRVISPMKGAMGSAAGAGMANVAGAAAGILGAPYLIAKGYMDAGKKNGDDSQKDKIKGS